MRAVQKLPSTLSSPILSSLYFVLPLILSSQASFSCRAEPPFPVVPSVSEASLKETPRLTPRGDKKRERLRGISHSSCHFERSEKPPTIVNPSAYAPGDKKGGLGVTKKRLGATKEGSGATAHSCLPEARSPFCLPEARKCRGTPRFARGDTSHRVFSRPTGPRDPSAYASGRQKGALGTPRLTLGATKKTVRGHRPSMSSVSKKLSFKIFRKFL